MIAHEYAKHLRGSVLLAALSPDPKMTFDSWAEKYYRFPKGDKHPGLYRMDRTPYAREILFELSPESTTQKVIFKKPTQVGATTLSNIILAAVPHAFAAHCLFVFPTVKMAEKHMKKKLSKAWRSIPELDGIIRDSRGDKSGNTMMYREFPGGSISLTGAGAIDAQRSDSIQILLMTDIDSPEFKVDQEGDPIGIFEKRTDAYGRKKKIYIESTPLITGASLIDIEYQKSSKGRYFVPCPHCGAFQFLEFGERTGPGFKFSRDKADRVRRAWFVCVACAQEIEEKNKFQMMIDGKYEHEADKNTVRGFMINSFYSPAGMVSWSQIAKEWLESYKYPKKLQVFSNTRLAKTFELPGVIRLKGEELQAKSEAYPLGVVPAQAQGVAFGVDTHDNRLDVVTIAFNISGESWVIGWQSLFGDPNSGESLQALDDLLAREFRSESGDRFFRCVSCAIDIKGHRTDAIKNFARTRYPVVIGVSGQASPAAPILGAPRDVDLFYDGARIKGGFKSWPVGTHEIKNTIFGNLTGDSGIFHLSKSLPVEFFLQLCAEELKVIPDKYNNISEKWVITRPGGQNHALDCCVYCLAGMSRVLNLEKMMNYVKTARREERPRPVEQVRDPQHRRPKQQPGRQKTINLW